MNIFVLDYNPKVADCTVMNYREYYRKEKAHILKYTNTQTPDWI